MTYIQLQSRINCQECGYPLPLNGPWRSYHCDNCQFEGELPEAYWIDVVKELVSDLHEMKAKPEKLVIFDEYDTNILFCKKKPHCQKCKTNYREMEAGGQTSFECDSCGKPATVMPAPDWLSSALPNLSVLYNATVRNEAPESTDAVRTVLFSCIQCGGGLKVDGTSRIITCSYCDSDNYIPDPLWLRIHPATMMVKWFIGLSKRGK